MVQMSNSQIESFFQMPRFTVFGTNSVDGPPQLTTVWFLYEAGAIYVGIERSSVKYRNLTRDPRVALCIDGEHPDGRTVVVYGLAKALESGTPESDRIAWRIARPYHDTDEEARRYQESISDLDLVLIKVTPQRLVGLDHGADASRVSNS
jgi:PPOX class probable F420-dependent enzyme